MQAILRERGIGTAAGDLANANDELVVGDWSRTTTQGDMTSGLRLRPAGDLTDALVQNPNQPHSQLGGESRKSLLGRFDFKSALTVMAICTEAKDMKTGTLATDQRAVSNFWMGR
jgi:hypothetical protein